MDEIAAMSERPFYDGNGLEALAVGLHSDVSLEPLRQLKPDGSSAIFYARRV